MPEVDDTRRAEVARHFETMAATITASDAPFGGAFVIVPPDGGEVLSALLNTSDAASDIFYLLLATQVQKARDSIDGLRPGGRR